MSGAGSAGPGGLTGAALSPAAETPSRKVCNFQIGLRFPLVNRGRVLNNQDRTTAREPGEIGTSDAPFRLCLRFVQRNENDRQGPEHHGSLVMVNTRRTIRASCFVHQTPDFPFGEEIWAKWKRLQRVRLPNAGKI